MCLLGERPFACDFSGCEKSFTRNEELTRHKRIHSGLKPFLCPVPTCNKQFGRKDHLKKHVKTHEQQQRPYGMPPPPAATAAVMAAAAAAHPFLGGRLPLRPAASAACSGMAVAGLPGMPLMFGGRPPLIVPTSR